MICVLPIEKIVSLKHDFADTSEFDDVIASTAEFCRLIHDEGKIDTQTYKRAATLLGSQGEIEQDNAFRFDLQWTDLY